MRTRRQAGNPLVDCDEHRPRPPRKAAARSLAVVSAAIAALGIIVYIALLLFGLSSDSPAAKRRAEPLPLLPAATAEAEAAPGARDVIYRPFEEAAEAASASYSLRVIVLTRIEPRRHCEGISVRLARNDGREEAVPPSLKETDSRGVARFPDLSLGNYSLVVGSERQSQVTIRGSEEEERIILLGDVVPVLVRALTEDRAPIDKATVWLRFRTAEAWSQEACTSSSGEAHVRMSDGMFSMYVSAEGFVPSEVIDARASDLASPELEFRLQRAMRVVSVRVENPEGRPVTGASVVFQISHGPPFLRHDRRMNENALRLNVVTDHTGLANMALAAGRFVESVHGWAQGLRTGILDLGHAKDRSQQPYVLRLCSGKSLRGVVTDRDDQPIGLAAVTFIGRYDGDRILETGCTTDVLGHFEFNGLPDAGTLFAKAAGYLHEFAEVPSIPVMEGMERYTIRLTRAMSQVCRVVDRNDNPVADSPVKVEIEGTSSDTLLSDVLTTDSEGKFIIRECPVGSLRARLVETTEQALALLRLADPDVPRNEEIKLICDETIVPRIRLTGRLITSNGSPPDPGLFIVLGAKTNDMMLDRGVRVSERTGEFDTGQVPDCEYVLYAMRGTDYAGWFGRVGGQTAWKGDIGTWALVDTGALEFFGMANDCRFQLWREGLRMILGSSARDGRGRFPCLPPGQYEAVLRRGSTEVARIVVEVHSGKVTEVRCGESMSASVR